MILQVQVPPSIRDSFSLGGMQLKLARRASHFGWIFGGCEWVRKLNFEKSQNLQKPWNPKIHEDFHGKNAPSDSVVFKIPKRNFGWQIKKRAVRPKKQREKITQLKNRFFDFPGSWTPFPQNAGCRSNELKHGNLFLTLWILWSFVFFCELFLLECHRFFCCSFVLRGFLFKKTSPTLFEWPKKRVGHLLNRNPTNS